MKSRIGHISLICAIAGFLLLEAAMHFDLLAGPFWRILATGFEAGTIGGLADWFAVSALFYEIPIPLVRRHTNIIVKNRDKLTEGIVELVTTKWLSPEMLREKLAGVEIAKNVVQVLEEPHNMDRTLDFIRTVFYRFTEDLDHPKMAVLLQKLLKDQIQDLDIAGPLGSWLKEAVGQKKHHEILEMAIGEISKSIEEPDTRKLVYKKLKAAVEEYAQKDWIKKSAIWLGKRTGGIDLDLLTDRLLDLALVLMGETKNDPQHPVRQKLDQYLLEFANALESGEEQAVSYVEQLKHNFILNDTARVIIQDMLYKLKNTLEGQLSHARTPFMELVKRQLVRFLDELKGDPEAQAKLDAWLKESLEKLVDKYHPELGNIVRSSLGRLDDHGMMQQIKDKVGDDLQYIRLNGAVVGGLVGIVIAVLRWLLL
ncbi:DUF445 domain-containing protein [Negadavirga shengliensis]|uniref:DUF445 domain-containing protein n=1 Tax=Negadavirga shengliensis TaxID=1389218 RepID=A0ABV9T479_9BACT